MSTQRQIGMQALKEMFAEWSDEGFVFVSVTVVHGMMDSITRVWTFASDTKIRTLRVNDYSIGWTDGPEFRIEDVKKVSFDEFFK